MSNHEVVSRRNLPHWFMPGASRFLTFRLAGTIPLDVLRELRSQRENRNKPAIRFNGAAQESPTRREFAHRRFFMDYDRYLDSHRNIDWLQRTEIGSIVVENLYHHHGSRYRLMSYCVMPNHVHAVFQPLGNPPLPRRSTDAVLEGDDESADVRSPLSSITHGWKSYTAHLINLALNRTGQVWQHESYDHWIRDEDELERIVAYVRGNPVAAGLTDHAENWPFSSCFDRSQFDGDLTGWLSDDCSSHFKKSAQSAELGKNDHQP